MPEDFSKIFIAEYNPIFGSELEITVPNIPNFIRGNYHFSHLCYGVSLRALVRKMEEKGYIFVGSNELNNNAFFVQKKYKQNLKIDCPEINNLDKYVVSNVRESRNQEGELSYLRKNERLKIIENCEVIDLSSQKNEVKKIKDIVKD